MTNGSKALLRLLSLGLMLTPSFATAKLKPKAKAYHIKSLVLIEPSGSVSLIVNPLRRTRMTIEVQNPGFVRERFKEKPYVGTADVEMDFYWTAQRQPMAVVQKISTPKDERLPAYDGDFVGE